MIIQKIKSAIEKGAIVYANLSGGKDGQAMMKHLNNNGVPVEAILHCDLGRVEWPQSASMCEMSAGEFGLPLHYIYRTDKKDMLGLWQARQEKLAGTGKPFWSSSKARYCTSDMKREPTDKFYRNCGHNFIISAEGIRADESTARGKKMPFEIRKQITSTYYDGMSVEEAIENYHPDYRLAITAYPVFEFNLEEVLNTYGMTVDKLHEARREYKSTNTVPAWWPFHAAYAMGNDRVSCMFCVLGSMNDLANGAKHNPELLNTLIQMEEESGATFKNKWSLKQLQA